MNAEQLIALGFNNIHDGFAKVWRNEAGFEIVQATDAISLLVYVRGDNGGIVFVGQKRLPLTGSANVDKLGLTWELIAGRLDKAGVSPVMIAVNEAREEAGITLESSEIRFMNGGKPVALSSGISTERCYLAYAVVDWDRLEEGVKFGAEAENEVTLRVVVPIAKLDNVGDFDCAVTMAQVKEFLRLLERGEIE